VGRVGVTLVPEPARESRCLFRPTSKICGIVIVEVSNPSRDRPRRDDVRPGAVVLLVVSARSPPFPSP